MFRPPPDSRAIRPKEFSAGHGAVRLVSAQIRSTRPRQRSRIARAMRTTAARWTSGVPPQKQTQLVRSSTHRTISSSVKRGAFAAAIGLWIQSWQKRQSKLQPAENTAKLQRPTSGPGASANRG
jgi:hypothetical protein